LDDHSRLQQALLSLLSSVEESERTLSEAHVRLARIESEMDMPLRYHDIMDLPELNDEEGEEEDWNEDDVTYAHGNFHHVNYSSLKLYEEEVSERKSCRLVAETVCEAVNSERKSSILIDLYTNEMIRAPGMHDCILSEWRKNQCDRDSCTRV
jgi:hypothetical protein